MPPGVDPVDRIFEVFESVGGQAYLGEPVTQLQHALQAAHLAVRDGAAPPLVCAALLHDIGHLLAGASEGAPAEDLCHENVGSNWLRAHFPESVSSPVQLHVAAKRFLCATEPEYLGRLSPASLHSLHLQGAAMSPEEIAAFAREPFHAEAVALRRWDDEAKDPSLDVRALETYRDLLRSLAIS
jgi:gamma-butyrobetaine dioxygenase